MFYIQYMSHVGGHISKSYPSGDVCVCVCVCLGMLTLLWNWSQSSGSRQIRDSGWPPWENLLPCPHSQQGHVHVYVCMCVCVCVCQRAGSGTDVVLGRFGFWHHQQPKSCLMSLSAMDLSHESYLGFSQNPSLFLSQVRVVSTRKHMVEHYVN